MTTTTIAMSLSHDVIIAAAQRAARAIPAVAARLERCGQPFLGQASEPLEVAAARLRRASGIAVTMPRSWYAERLQSGEITEDDLQAAFQTAPAARRPPNVSALKHAIKVARPAPQAIPTVAELARDVTAIDWPGIVNERIGHWAAGYFDQGQALWAVGQSGGAYSTWRIIATHDLTPEIAGLAGFHSLCRMHPPLPKTRSSTASPASVFPRTRWTAISTAC